MVAAMTNVFEPSWDTETDNPPYRWRRSRIGRQAGSEQLGASLFDVPPGASTFPFHLHHANEELVVVLAGSLVLRTTDGERTLSPGDVVACPTGPRGAHRLTNEAAEHARVLIVSTMNAPEVNEFPDSGLVWARTSVPGHDQTPADVDVAGAPGHLDPLTLP
jgi:uncharacterized cupin superfamily protein